MRIFKSFKSYLLTLVIISSICMIHNSLDEREDDYYKIVNNVNIWIERIVQVWLSIYFY